MSNISRSPGRLKRFCFSYYLSLLFCLLELVMIEKVKLLTFYKLMIVGD